MEGSGKNEEERDENFGSSTLFVRSAPVPECCGTFF